MLARLLSGAERSTQSDTFNAVRRSHKIRDASSKDMDAELSATPEVKGPTESARQDASGKNFFCAGLCRNGGSSKHIKLTYLSTFFVQPLCVARVAWYGRNFCHQGIGI